MVIFLLNSFNAEKRFKIVEIPYIQEKDIDLLRVNPHQI